jgi:lysozyme
MKTQMSDNGKRLLAQWEGIRLEVYNDVAGVPTIGVGHKLTPQELSSGLLQIGNNAVAYADGITQQQAMDLLGQDLVPYEKAVNSFVMVPLNQNQFDALVSFAFNVGLSAFHGSTLLKVLNQGGYDQVPAQLLRWTHADGEVVPGLVTRRKNEIELWNS